MIILKTFFYLRKFAIQKLKFLKGLGGTEMWQFFKIMDS